MVNLLNEVRRLRDRLGASRHRLARRRWALRHSGPPRPQTILSALDELERRGCGVLLDDSNDDAESPIFILATGWRTGSTLLQRICMTDGGVLLFGEPLGRCGFIPRLTTALSAVSPQFPNSSWELGGSAVDFSTSFPANLYPPLTDLREAMRALLLRWLAHPARERGYRQWGLKEVRLSGADACLIRWLFPRARILVLTRHPVEVFKSSRRLNLWYQWPERPVDGGMGVIGHWNRLASSWADVSDGFGHQIVKYETLVSGEFDFRGLGAFLGLELNEDEALSAVTGSTAHKQEPTASERRAVMKAAAEGMMAMGYSQAQ